MKPLHKGGLLAIGLGAFMVAIGKLDGKKRSEAVTPVDGAPPLVNVARAEAQRWVGLTEKSPEAESILSEYWASTGQAYPGPETAWSAAFINWAVTQADGPDALFKSGAHIYYARQAYRDRGVSGRYGAFRPSEVEIQPGDIIVSGRDGSGLTFDNLTNGGGFISAHADIVIDRVRDTLRVVGGNVNDTVNERAVNANSPNIVAVLRMQREPIA